MWQLYAIACALLWGTGYTILTRVHLDRFTINVMYGGCLLIVNFLASIMSGQLENFYMIPDYGLYLFFYIGIMISGAIVFMTGYGTAGSYASAFTAISSAYPMIQIILSQIFLSNQTINLYYAIPGIICIVTGVILLTVS